MRKTCENCELGERKTLVGNGITEPPYIEMIRCPFDDKYYKYPDNNCEYKVWRNNYERS